MNEFDAAKRAGQVLRKLISENYSSQEEFAFEYGADVRTINRYINNGINKIDVIQDFAELFNVDFVDFFKEQYDKNCPTTIKKCVIPYIHKERSVWYEHID